MKNIVYHLLLGCFLMVLASCSGTTGNAEKSAVSTQEETDQTQPECHYCGMRVNDFPKWNAWASTSEKGQLHFCSARCLMIVLKEEEPSLTPTDVRVTDYYTSRKIDGQQAIYIIGSRQIGPMGPDFIATDSQEAADEFSRDYQGRGQYRYGQITPEVIRLAIQPPR